MTLANLVAIGLALVGLVLAVQFGVHAMRHLAAVRRTPPLATPAKALATDPADDLPTMRFKGEAFEQGFGGSRGYDRPEAAWAPGGSSGRNWTDYLVVSVVTPLRPSRFSDPGYWTRYLPGVLALRVLVFMVLPLLVIALASGSGGAVGTFAPTAAQRHAPGDDVRSVTDPPVCGGANAGATNGKPVYIDDVDGGVVYVLHPGAPVFISYLHGRPVFSPDAPLCVPAAAATADKVGVAEYRVTGSGSGYVYIPQPDGTVVAQIEVASSSSTLVFVIVGITAVVLCFDVSVLVRLRRAARARSTRVGG